MVRSLTNTYSWHVAHASATGVSHLASQSECQDRFACQTIETESDGAILIAAVADGAGSTSDGQTGAELACKLFIEEVSDFLESKNASIKSLTIDFGRLWIEYFQRQISATAESDKKAIREYSSTFVGAVVGEKHAAFFQLGDGGIVVSNSGEQNSYRFAVAPVESLYVNMTDFLTDETAAANLRFEIVEESLTDVILFSDGIFSVAVNYQTNEPHEPFLMPMLAPLRGEIVPPNLNGKLEKFLDSPKINEKTDDDKTIILASRKVRKENSAAPISRTSASDNS